MKRLRHMNRLLVVLALLLGIALGTAAALLSLSLVNAERWLSLGGLICVILTAVLALLFPILVHYREAWIYKVNSMQLRFGTEVPFLDENAFLSSLPRQMGEEQVYALHLTLVGTPGELEKKSAGFALAESLSKLAPANWKIGYTELGDFLFYGPRENEDFLRLIADVDHSLAQDQDIPPYGLLLGVSTSGKDGLEKANQALTATLLDEVTRENLSLQPYYEEEPMSAKLDLNYELEQGRLRYYLTPYGEYGEDEKRIAFALLAPAIYDPYRGELVDKELFHAVELSASRSILDHGTLLEALDLLLARPDIDLLGVRLGPDTLLEADLLSSLASKAKEAGVDLGRLALFAFGPSLGEHGLRAFFAKAKGLGIHVGVYEYGGESLESLYKLAPEYVLLKPELLRASADKEFLLRLLQALSSFGTKPLLNHNDPLAERSALVGGERVRLPRKEEEA